MDMHITETIYYTEKVTFLPWNLLKITIISLVTGLIYKFSFHHLTVSCHLASLASICK